MAVFAQQHHGLRVDGPVERRAVAPVGFLRVYGRRGDFLRYWLATLFSKGRTSTCAALLRPVPGGGCGCGYWHERVEPACRCPGRRCPLCRAVGVRCHHGWGVCVAARGVGLVYIRAHARCSGRSGAVALLVCAELRHRISVIPAGAIYLHPPCGRTGDIGYRLVCLWRVGAPKRGLSGLRGLWACRYAAGQGGHAQPVRAHPRVLPGEQYRDGFHQHWVGRIRSLRKHAGARHARTCARGLPSRSSCRAGTSRSGLPPCQTALSSHCPARCGAVRGRLHRDFFGRRALCVGHRPHAGKQVRVSRSRFSSSS